MTTRPVTKTLFKSAEPREDAEERHGHETEAQTPRNIPPNTAPTEGFSLEIDGKTKSQHATSEAAMAIGAELKRKFPVLQVVVCDAVSKTRTPVKAAK
ncbi:MAG TPA: hypothetical protein VGG01_14020 [Xanthobacteraceae bacterium]|jgi:hypothetical protein